MPILTNLIWGIRWGVKFTLVYSAFALLVLLFGGSATFRQSGATFLLTIGLYVFGGLIAGAIVGLLRPLARWATGATIVGIIAAVPVCVMGRYVIDQSPWTVGDTIVWSIMAVIGGGLCGFFAKRISERRP